MQIQALRAIRNFKYVYYYVKLQPSAPLYYIPANAVFFSIFYVDDQITIRGNEYMGQAAKRIFKRTIYYA